MLFRTNRSKPKAAHEVRLVGHSGKAFSKKSRSSCLFVFFVTMLFHELRPPCTFFRTRMACRQLPAGSFFAIFAHHQQKRGNAMRALTLIVGLSLAGPALANCNENYLEFLNSFSDLRFQRMLLETEPDGPMPSEEKQERADALLSKAQSTRGLIASVREACQDNPQFVDAVTKAEAYVDAYEEDLKTP